MRQDTWDHHQSSWARFISAEKRIWGEKTGSNMGVNEINRLIAVLFHKLGRIVVICRPHEPYDRCLFSKQLLNEPNSDVKQKVWKHPKMVSCLSNSTYFFSPESDLVDPLLFY